MNTTQLNAVEILVNEAPAVAEIAESHLPVVRTLSNFDLMFVGGGSSVVNSV